MTTMTQFAHGQFNWVDLNSHDMEVAKDFYAALFGWRGEKQDTQGGPPYLMFFNGEHPVAGMGQMSDEMKAQGVPQLWNTYVSVDDAEAVHDKAVSLGAQSLMPVMKILDAGSMTFLTDPEGATFAIWQADQHIGATLVNAPVSLCWNELNTRDLGKAKGFYGELFGWNFDAAPDAPSPYEMIKNGDALNGGMLQMNEQWGDIPANWMVYFAVADCDGTVERCKELGGSLHVPAMDIPVGRFAVLADSQGGVFSVIQLKD